MLAPIDRELAEDDWWDYYLHDWDGPETEWVSAEQERRIDLGDGE